MANQASEVSEDQIDHFNMLPEVCIVDTVSYTSPVDACRLALVASSLRLIADSDAVWERFLPPDYLQLISRAANYHDLLALSPKKDLYRYLCDHPVLIDNGNMSFSLDKWTGKKCYMIAARGLKIPSAPDDDKENWRWTPDSKSRFAKTIVLIRSAWFDIQGKINTSLLSPDTAYTTYLVYKTTFGIFGFEHQSVKISVGIIGEECMTRTVCLDPRSMVHRRNVTVPPRTRKDGWLEIELAEYYNKEGENRELGISLKNPRYVKRHSGLIIEGLEIRPTAAK